jgi:epoxyqueuosine reductase
MLAEALNVLHEKGHRAAAVPMERLEELHEHYQDLSRRGLLDRQIAHELLSGLSFGAPESVSNPRSLVVVASRDPSVSCTFTWHGTDFRVSVPPTYLHLRRKSAQVTRDLEEALLEGSHAACLINAPHKLLAVRSGLAQYGRNNITYIPGLGSYYRLTTVCTDVPASGGEWRAPSMMSKCRSCKRCVAACPTGAMSEGNPLVRAELCITYWNEKPGDTPFPDWMAEDWHNCLVGCMRCQMACPENEAVPDFEEAGPSFTEEETELLLRPCGPGDLPGCLEEKLREWDLLEWLGALPRNLAVLLSGGKRQPSG